MAAYSAINLRKCGAIPPDMGVSIGGCVVVAITRRRPSAFLLLSSGRMTPRCVPVRGSTRSTDERSHRATRTLICMSARYRHGNSKRIPPTVKVPSERRTVRDVSRRKARRSSSEEGLGLPTVGEERAKYEQAI